MKINHVLFLWMLLSTAALSAPGLMIPFTTSITPSKGSLLPMTSMRLPHLNIGIPR